MAASNRLNGDNAVRLPPGSTIVKNWAIILWVIITITTSTASWVNTKRDIAVASNSVQDVQVQIGHLDERYIPREALSVEIRALNDKIDSQKQDTQEVKQDLRDIKRALGVGERARDK